jgi:CoA:oxalate CoA-transferase
MMVRGRNKESITIDLKTVEGVRVFRDLVRHADLVVENYSAGVTQRLGIDYESVRDLNPKLVYTSISGFGAQGGYGGGKAMDTIIQALSGVMMTAGEEGDAPVRFGLPVGDLVTPLFAVIGTLSAIISADETGLGQHVDVSMLGALTSLVACEPFDAYESVGMPLRTGQYLPRLAPFGTFQASDGWFALCAPKDEFARGVFAALGEPELGEGDRFGKRDSRVANSDELHARIAHWARTLSVAEAVNALESNGVPVAPVRGVTEAIRDPLVLGRGEVVPLALNHASDAGPLYGTGVPIRFSRSATGLDRAAPRLGEHTADVLRATLGYDQDNIDRLRESGIV